MLTTRTVAYGALAGAAATLAVLCMGVLGWPLPVAAAAGAVVVSPAVVLARVGAWAKAVVEHAVGMR